MSNTDALAGEARSSVLTLNINSKSALYAAYMPFLANGGIFVPTSKTYALDEDVFVLLQLLDDPAKHPVTTKVAWVTPAGAQDGKTQGVGLHFSADDAGRSLRGRIETMLAGMIGSASPTYTL